MRMSHEHCNDISNFPNEPWLCPTCNFMEQTQGHNSNVTNDPLESINSEEKPLEELPYEVSSSHGRDIANEELLHIRNLLVSGKFINTPPITANDLQVELTSIKCRLVTLESQLKSFSKPSPQEINPQKLYLSGSGITGPVTTVSISTTNQTRKLPPNSSIRHPNEPVEEFYNKHNQFYSDLLSSTIRRDDSADFNETGSSFAEENVDPTLSRMANNITITSTTGYSKPELSKYRFYHPVHRQSTTRKVNISVRPKPYNNIPYDEETNELNRPLQDLSHRTTHIDHRSQSV
ncbi:hypothetical protein J6590_061649 [Homalodisca vitripennis]|nr:hypothetical protein J6590_061649 [Homalodisca vitripennis]